MTSTLDTSRSAGDRRRDAAYLREFLPAMGAALLAGLLVGLLGGFTAPAPWRFALVLIPLLPLGFACAAVARHLRRIDEYERRVLVGALGVGFAAAMLAAVGLALLEPAGLRVPLAPIWVVIVGMTAWAIGLAPASRR